MKPLPPLQDLRRHIANLLTRYNIEHRIVSQKEPLRWVAVHAERRAEFPSVRNSFTYLVALHEIGHFIIISRRGGLLNEAAVWIWVKDSAIIWLPEFDEIVAFCMRRHAERIEISNKVESFVSP